jgi:GDP-4-dehydro-6-deoxy-D-mannose reductase
MKFLKLSKVVEENPRVNELEAKGLIIKPDKVDDYLRGFKNVSSDEPHQDYWDEKRVLITGINGFAGSHLADSLVGLGSEVHGLIRSKISDNITHLKDKINVHEADITNHEKMIKLFEDVRPNVVFHLAAESFVPTSFNNPSRVARTNIEGTINVFEAGRRVDADLEALQLACSSEQYGLVHPSEVPIAEENPFRPRSVYGVTKCAAEKTAWYYLNSHQVPSVLTRAFNHEGPRRGDQFFTSVVHKQAAEVIKGLRGNIVIGNPNSIRDFTHVKDMVNAYLLCCEKAKRGEPYNICSGKGISIADYILLTKKILGIKAEVMIDSDKMRPSEVPLLIGDNSKVRDDVGWRPTIPITEVIRQGVNYYQEKL